MPVPRTMAAVKAIAVVAASPTAETTLPETVTITKKKRSSQLATKKARVKATAETTVEEDAVAAVSAEVDVEVASVVDTQLLESPTSTRTTPSATTRARVLRLPQVRVAIPRASQAAVEEVDVVETAEVVKEVETVMVLPEVATVMVLPEVETVEANAHMVKTAVIATRTVAKTANRTRAATPTTREAPVVAAVAVEALVLELKLMLAHQATASEHELVQSHLDLRACICRGQSPRSRINR